MLSGNNNATKKVEDKRIKGRHGEYKLNVTSTATHNVEIELKDKSEVKMLILTKDQARNSWKIKDIDEEHLMIFDGEVIQNV